MGIQIPDDADDVRRSALHRGDRFGRSLFVAAGGGGDVIAASILRRKLGRPDDPYVATYSWDRRLIDPAPGPRDPSCFDGLVPFGLHNYVVSSSTVSRAPWRSSLPRVARDLDTCFYLLDPQGGACGVRRQLLELVRRLDVQQVYLVDSGGDVVAHGDEGGLLSPLADALTLAASDGLSVSVDVVITAPGLDGELSSEYVRAEVAGAGGEQDWSGLTSSDVGPFASLLRWHPSEVNGLMIAAARGFRGVVEIRDDALRVRVDDGSASVHRCGRDALIARNQLAKSMLESSSLVDADASLADQRDWPGSDLARQQRLAQGYHDRAVVADVDGRVERLLAYGAERSGVVDALSLRRAAEVMEVNAEGLAHVGIELAERFPQRFEPPLWLLR